MSLSANWIWREVVAVPVMTPAEGLMLLPMKTTAFGSAKFRMIENVEGLRAKLQTPPLIDADLLE
jgi:hypothetical protein